MKIEQHLDTIIENFLKLKAYAPSMEEIAKAWITSLEQGNKIMFCGNGGSAGDSQHLSAELVGRYKMNRPALSALSLTVDTSALTAIANDFGYEHVFSRQVEGLGKAGDCLVGISTSGNSQNIVNAFLKAKEMSIKTIAFTGESGGKMKELADICLNVPSSVTNNIQEMHIACGHILCDMVEKHFFAA
jgi:D-sedoheptulose 7-phosphate isomerase